MIYLGIMIWILGWYVISVLNKLDKIIDHLGIKEKVNEPNPSKD